MKLLAPILLATFSFGAKDGQLTSVDYFKRASEQLAQGLDQLALNDFRRSLAADPKFMPAQYSLATTLLRLGLIDQAIEAADSAKCQDSRCHSVLESARQFQEYSYEASLESDNGCVLYTYMLEIAPKSAQTLKSRAQCLFERGSPIDAVRDLISAVQIDKSDAMAAAQAAIGSFVLIDQQQQALQILRQCVAYDDAAKECKAALKSIRKLQKATEKVPPQKLKVNSIIKETRRLLDQYKIPRHGHDEEGFFIDKLRRQRCTVLAERGLYDQASTLCAQVRDLDPDFYPAILVQAHVERDQGNLQEALNLLSNIIRTAQENPEAEISQRITELAMAMHEEIRVEQTRPHTPHQQSEKDLYKILGVDKSADKRKIRKAYRELSRKYHPDKYKGGELSEEEIMQKMQDINEAYEILSDDKRRGEYDQQQQDNAQFRHGGGGGGGHGGFPGGFPGGGQFNVKNFGGFPGGMNFQQFFRN